jgi:REP element-mobilizing transposase RayT
MSDGIDIGAIKMKGRQGAFEIRRWGGKRKGAGRKATVRAGQPRHRRVRKRATVTAREPVHVVVRVVPRIGRLRRRKAYAAIRWALLTVLRRGLMRVVHVSIQRTHLHLLVEAEDERCLARGMQGFLISAAKQLNAVLTVEEKATQPVRGQVFATRYHAEIIDAPRRARSCLAYVLNNWRRHREDVGGGARRRARIDPYSSGIVFAGWRDHSTPFAWPRNYLPMPVAPPRSWLLTDGWRRHGPVGLREVPGPRA